MAAAGVWRWAHDVFLSKSGGANAPGCRAGVTAERSDSSAWWRKAMRGKSRPVATALRQARHSRNDTVHGVPAALWSELRKSAHEATGVRRRPATIRRNRRPGTSTRPRPALATTSALCTAPATDQRTTPIGSPAQDTRDALPLPGPSPGPAHELQHPAETTEPPGHPQHQQGPQWGLAGHGRRRPREDARNLLALADGTAHNWHKISGGDRASYVAGRLKASQAATEPE